MKKKLNYTKTSINLHNALGWWGIAALIIWALSGAAHPIMSWLGPKAKSFFPPSMLVETEKLKSLPTLLSSREDFNHARVIKIVPSSKGPLIQVTTNENSPRKYFNLETGSELVDFDSEQAKWLASYYTGQPVSAISSIEFQTEFDDNYPWVNRLLPVYNIHFEGDDNLRIFVHTETSAMAGLNNQLKTSLQWFFQHLHTFKWLNGIEYARLIIVALLMLCLIATAILGLLLVIALKSRKIKDSSRRYHRWLAYVLWLPLLTWSASGFYHLLQSSLVDSPSGIRLGQTFSESAKLSSISANTHWLDSLKGTPLNSVSLLPEDNTFYYRVSISDTSRDTVSRAQRYSGRPSEKRSVFIDAITGQVSDAKNDKQHAQMLAAVFANVPASRVGEASLITRFGPDYDFRNKRLPVWQVKIDDDDSTWLFIDPSTGVLVDQSNSTDRIERWSFSFLHKWNFLTPFTGRMTRDVIIVAFLGVLLIMGGFGVKLMLTRRAKAPS